MLTLVIVPPLQADKPKEESWMCHPSLGISQRERDAFYNGFAMRSTFDDANVGQAGIGVTIH